jgi:Mn-dependent DtxR family transcriptional regulator
MDMGLSELETEIWRVGSEMQRRLRRGSPSPSFDEIALMVGVTKQSVSNAVSVLKRKKIARYDNKIRRSLWFEKLYPRTIKKSKAVQ